MLIVAVATTGRTRMMTILVATLMAMEKHPVRRMTGNEISAEISFFFILLLDKCGPVWYNNSGDQRAGVGRPGPIFRSVYPIWKIFATSSDLSYALNFPVKLGPRRADRELPSYGSFS